ncbi:RNA polymerase sigma factor [Pedobacter arcticus]|uniref:RNA polymerase sigma factor n=1 Tax=Pedobacter arcticus TaxID=752140 RepID=UPI00037A3449|nr:sigma-70 family RNA polymerase sigma factor [Pedobacter arcticus]
MDPKRKEANFPDEHFVTVFKDSGDLQVLGNLYKNYMPLVYGVCLKYFKNPEQSQDAVMQIFEQLIHKLRNHEVKNFKSWLYVLTRNFCLMELRKSKKVTIVNIEDTFVESDALLHHDDSDTKENRLLLMEACLETLVEEQQQTLKLFYLEQRCYTEVADRTGYELKKVKSYIQNGKRNLKICIEKSSE